MTARKAIDDRDKLAQALIACADWAFVARMLLRDRALLPPDEASALSVALLAFERRVLGNTRVLLDMEG